MAETQEPSMDELKQTLAVERRAHAITRGQLADAVTQLAHASLVAEDALQRLEAPAEG